MREQVNELEFNELVWFCLLKLKKHRILLKAHCVLSVGKSEDILRH